MVVHNLVSESRALLGEDDGASKLHADQDGHYEEDGREDDQCKRRDDYIQDPLDCDVGAFPDLYCLHVFRGAMLIVPFLVIMRFSWLTENEKGTPTPRKDLRVTICMASWQTGGSLISLGHRRHPSCNLGVVSTFPVMSTSSWLKPPGRTMGNG